MARSISPTSPSPLAANTEVKTVADEHLQNAAPDEEMDELDAKEAAQFKADVQGHRHHEVGLQFCSTCCAVQSSSRLTVFLYR